MHLLMLASYFPKPGNPLIGTWALDQAQALRRAGADVRVVSLTPWIPRWPGQRSAVQAYSMCPPSADWNGLRADYPRWPYYPVTAVERLYLPNPELWMRLAWSVCQRRVMALARQWHPDVIFAHHSCVNGWVAMRIAANLGVPFFCQDHALWEISACKEHPKRRRMLNSIASHASAMLVVSRRMAADLRRVAPTAHIEMLYNGANLPPPAPQPTCSCPRPPVIFSAGMLIPYKAFDILLQAWAIVRARFPEARLRIAGEGPERDRLLALRENLGLEESVELLGCLPQSAVQAEMAAARAFVLASWHETFGVVLIEAAAVGTPVVWANNAGAADILEDGIHGLAIAPHSAESAASAILRLLSNPGEAASMGAAASRLVRERMTWDAVARRAIGLFSAALPPSAQRLH
jgi:glycosyltransferase involved in cell wall biosynthesis